MVNYLVLHDYGSTAVCTSFIIALVDLDSDTCRSGILFGRCGEVRDKILKQTKIKVDQSSPLYGFDGC